MLRRAILLLAMLVAVAAPWRPAHAAEDKGATYASFETFVAMLEQVKRSYVSEVDDAKLFYGAYKGMLAELDPYSQFMAREDVEQYAIDTVGEFGGLGIEITLDEKRVLMVITPIEDTPAMRSGILAGDRIVEIEGKSTYNMTLTDAIKVLRGKPGSKVALTVVHQSTSKREKVTVTRDIIKVKSVRAVQMVDGDAKVGYVRLSRFQKTTAEELREAVQQLLGQGMKALVLDLRRNPGGLLDSTVAVADQFLEGGLIVSTKGRAKGTDHRFEARKQGTFPSFPLAVLVSGYTATGAEIVAGAIQDHRRGVIVGVRTFGKGTVQSILPIGDGCKLRLTTAKYHTPAGRVIHRDLNAKESDPWGIMPDIEVKTTYEEEVALLKHWQQQNVAENAPSQPGTEAPPAFVDRVLVRATEVLRDSLQGKTVVRKEPVTVERRTGPRPRVAGVTWAVVIGISKYRDTRVPGLRYASRDAKEFHDWLVDPKGGGHAPARVRLLLDGDATGKAIRETLFDWSRQALAEDSFVIYFAGHGSPASPDASENLFLLPHDVDYQKVAATGFPMRDIETALKRFIKAKRVVVLADACHAGGVGAGFAGTQRSLAVVPGRLASALQNLTKVTEGVAVLTASGAKQLSQEGEKWGGGHGVFTFFLLKGLKGEADYNKDRVVTLGELIPYLSEHVRRETRNAQSPEVAGKFDLALMLSR
ncbi:S41 family peptidase [Planctomycetota bacterium]